MAIRKPHLAPDDPGSRQQELLNDERAMPFVNDFKDLFWKINAPADLLTFRSFCVNLLDIIHEAQETWGTIEEDPGVSRWIPCLEWIKNEPLETALFKDRTPYKTEDHAGVPEKKLIFLGHGMARHQVYGTVFFRHPGDEESKQKYRLLVAHLIFGHAKMMRRIGQKFYQEYVQAESIFKYLHDNPDLILKNYENDDPDSIPKKVGDPAKAATAIRILADASDWLRRADLLLLPPHLLLKEFEHHPPDIEISRSRDIELFLQLAYGLRELEEETGGDGKGGAPWIHGTSWITDGYEHFGDEEDQTDVLGRRLSQRKRSVPDEERKFDADFSDECPDEDDDGTDETLETVEVTADSDLWEAEVAHSRHVERNNQRFRWEYDTLAAEEIQSLISKLTQNALERAAYTTLGKEDWEHIELAALLNVMFWMARPLKQARHLVVSSVPIVGNYPLGLQLAPDGGIWRVRAPLPERVRPFSVPQDADRERSECLEVYDRSNALGLFRRLYERNKSGATPLPSRLFDIKKPKSWYIDRMHKLPEFTPRLTNGRISNFLLSKLLEVSGGDVVASAIVSGRELSFARVKMYYACRPAKKLDELYRRTTDKVRVELGMEKLDECKEVRHPNRYITNQVCPNFEKMKSTVEDLKRKIYELSELRRKGKRDFDAKDRLHNAYTLYTVWMFSFATGIRGIATPYLDLETVGKDGIATLADKGNSSGYKRRLIWIPKPVLEQMNMYRVFIQWSRRMSNFKDMPCFFILWGEDTSGPWIRLRDVRPSTQRAVLDDLFPRNPDGSKYFDFPMNTHRRFMLTELVEAGCPPQVCDAWMGHWYRAEEPWGPFSSFSHKNARRILEDRVPKILESLGFVPLSQKPHKRMIK